MIFKRLFDIVASLLGLLLIWWIFPIVALLIHKKMPGGPAFFCQKRVGKDGRLFTCHKFRSMTVKHSGSSVSVAGDSRITPFGAKLRHYKIDELPELWIVKSDQEVAVWYNDNVIYPDKVRLNCHYYRHYSFWKDIEMIFATVLGFKVKFAGEEV